MGTTTPRAFEARASSIWKWKVVDVWLLMLVWAAASVRVRGAPEVRSDALVLLKAESIADMNQSISELEQLGVHVLHVFPPCALVCSLPLEAERAVSAHEKVRTCHRGPFGPADQVGLAAEARLGVLVWNRLLTPTVPLQPRLAHRVEPLIGDAFPHAARGRTLPAKGAGISPAESPAPDSNETSEFMIGKLAVGIILPESNGSGENWSAARQDQVISEIAAGCNWWATKGGSSAHLTFYYDIHRSVPTQYEPIQRPYYDEALWIPETLGYLGYSGVDYKDVCRTYDNALRNQFHTDWAFTIFVVDSLNDADGKFSDGLFAYSYLGGPFMVMTYGNDGYGISNMHVVAAHEIGHIFWALDEYGGASSCSATSGYLNVSNGNHVYCSSPPDPNCIMRRGITDSLCTYSRGHIGWRDSDADSIFDPADTSVTVVLTTIPADPANPFGGFATDVAYPPGSSTIQSCTINIITNVEYRLDGGAWLAAMPNDGAFGSSEESYGFTLASAGRGLHTVEVRARNSVGNLGSQLYSWSAVPGVVYVDHAYGGTNSNGSLSAPFRTVTEGYHAALSGNTISIFNGNYNESILMSKPLLLQTTNGVVNIGRQ